MAQADRPRRRLLSKLNRLPNWLAHSLRIPLGRMTMSI